MLHVNCVCSHCHSQKADTDAEIALGDKWLACIGTNLLEWVEELHLEESSIALPWSLASWCQEIMLKWAEAFPPFCVSLMPSFFVEVCWGASPRQKFCFTTILWHHGAMELCWSGLRTLILAKILLCLRVVVQSLCQWEKDYVQVSCGASFTRHDSFAITCSILVIIRAV